MLFRNALNEKSPNDPYRTLSGSLAGFFCQLNIQSNQFKTTFKTMNEVSFKPTTARPDPLAIPNVTRIQLEPHQAKILEGLGQSLVTVGKASYPNQAGWCLLALPVSKDAATAACGVALGTHTAKRIKAVSVKPRTTTAQQITP